MRAIHFEAAPSAPHTGGLAVDAVDALAALQSVTASGLSYAQYSSRVLDARIRVNRYLAAPAANDFASKAAVRLAMRYYELASQAWNSSLTKDARLAATVGTSVKGDACADIRNVAYTAIDDKPSSVGFALGEHPSAFWSCAKSQVAEAQRLLK